MTIKFYPGLRSDFSFSDIVSFLLVALVKYEPPIAQPLWTKLFLEL